MEKDRTVKFEVGDRICSDRYGLGTVVGIPDSYGTSWKRVTVRWDAMCTNEFCESLEMVRKAVEPEEVPEP